MAVKAKTKSELIDENKRLKDRIALLEAKLGKYFPYDEVSDHKNGRKKILESEEKFASIFNSAADGIVYMDKKAVIIEANQALIQISGIPRSELVGKSAIDLARKFLHTKDLPRVMAAIKQMLKGNPIEHFELQYKDVFFEISIPINKKSAGLTAVFRDITEKKKYEETLKVSEQLFRNVFHTNLDSISINRLEDGIFVNINQGYEQETGYSAEDVIGRSSFEINIWADPKDREKLVEGLKKHGRVSNLEAKFRKKNGQVVRGLMSASIIEINKVPHILSVARNIEDVKIAQDSLIASEALLSSIVKVAPIAIGLIENSIFKKVNDMMCEMTGYSHTELLDQSARILYPDYDEHRRVDDIIYAQIMEKGTGTLKTKWLCKDGKSIDVILSSTLLDINDVSKGVIFTALDVTEQKEYEKARQESEQRFRSIFECAISGIAFGDGKGALILANKALQDILGYDSIELYRMNFGDFTYKEDLPREYKLIQELVENKRDKYRIEKRYVRKNKELVWVDVAVSVIRDELGKPKFYVGVVQDINDRKLAEDKLREREEFLETLIENIPNMIFVKDAKDLKFIRFNKAGEELLGYSRDELIGKCDHDFFSKEEADFFTGKDREVLATGELKDIPEEVINTKYLGERILHTKKIPLLGKGGKARYLLGISEDITDNKKAEEALRQSEQKLRNIFENSSNVFYSHDVNHNITYFSPQIKDLLGYVPEEAMVKWTELTVDNQLKEEAKIITEKAIETGITQSPYEVELIHKNGNKVTVEVREAPVVEDGITVGIVGALQDITERKNAEKKLLEREEQYRALAARQRNIREEERIYIARELHDQLGQGLTGLKMDISWMVNKLMSGELDKAGPELRDKAKSVIELIDENIKAVRKMSTELRPNVLDYLGLEAAIEWQLNEFQNRSGINCHFKSCIERLHLEPLYSTNIFRIFQEILTNILRHAGAGKVDVKLSTRENKLIMMVQDNGKGIEKGEIVNINSLGILGMKERASILDGEIVIEGRAGGGTKVTLNVPLKENAG